MARTRTRTRIMCCLSGFTALSDRTRIMCSSKPLRSLEQQQEPAPKGGGIQDDRPPTPPPLYYGRAPAYDSRPSVSSFEKWEEGGGMSKPLWSLQQQEPPLPSSGDRPTYYSGGIQDYHFGGGFQDYRPVNDDRPTYYGGGIQDDHRAYYGDDRPTAYYGDGIQDDPPPYPDNDIIIQDVQYNKKDNPPSHFRHNWKDRYDRPAYLHRNWLDDVQGYFEFMELAHELHSIDCLYDLLHYVLVYRTVAAFRAKTAELVTTMVHNNPRSQQLVMELDGLKPLWYNFTSDPDATSRTKALGAISALIRNNKSGITAFRERNGYAALGDALSSENVWFQREALNLIMYLLHENSSDCNTITELGLPRIMMHLTSSDDAEVQVAAVGGLLVLARNEGGNSGQLVKNDDKLKQVLQELMKRFGAMALEDLVAAREEIQLTELGLPRIMMHLASSDNAEVRVAALVGLLVLAKDEGGNSGQLVKNDDKLKQVLQELMKRFSKMAVEDLVAACEEIQLVDSLLNVVDPKLPIETLLV